MEKGNGFLRVAAGVPNVKVASCQENAINIETILKKESHKDISLYIFPELCLTSVSCGDLYSDKLLLEESIIALEHLITNTASYKSILIVGLPLVIQKRIYNVAAVIGNGHIYGIVPRQSSGVNRCFSSFDSNLSGVLSVGALTDIPFGTNLEFSVGEVSFNVCFWEDGVTVNNTVDFSVVLSAEPSIVGSDVEILKQLETSSLTNKAAYIYASPGFGESTTDFVYGGLAAVVDQGVTVAQSQLFDIEAQCIVSEIDIAHKQSLRSKQYSSRGLDSGSLFVDIESDVISPTSLHRTISRNPFIPQGVDETLFATNAYNIQVMGLVQRMLHTRTEKVVIGVSGGLDSTLALLVCLKAFEKMNLPSANIIGITMPGFGTSGRTKNNADILMEQMGITTLEIGIKDACLQHFKDINHDASVHDVTYENSQARERTQILMDYANKVNALVIGTGDLSELALGWATYNGDHMSMYGVNSSVPKTMVQFLVRKIAETTTNKVLSHSLFDILDTPISPELTPASDTGVILQKTEDLVGPYELHDFFIFHMMVYGYRPSIIYERAKLAFKGTYTDDVIKHWLKTFYRRFFMQQFKRSCSPDGPNVTGVSLSPRNVWNMASDVTAEIWLREVSELS